MPESVPYRLSISAGLETFRPELEFACEFLDRCYFVKRSRRAETVLHYGTGAPKQAISVPASLFPTGVELRTDGIYPNRAGLRRLERSGGHLLPPRKTAPTAKGNLSYDALGLVFFMLSRLEERGCEALDDYGRFPASVDLAVRHGRYADPLADQAARDLAARITGQLAPSSRTRYRIEPTHDVDKLRAYHRPWQPLRRAAGDAVKRRDPAAAFAGLRHAYAGGEPWRSVRDLMDLSDRCGLKSRFFFMGPSRLTMDSPYARTMRGLLRRVSDAIVARNHHVGFHPGFATACDADEWRRQREGLESVIGRPVHEGRQHVLQYAADRTPEIWDDAGMTRDYTLAYPEHVGFRNGTCRPHLAYSLRRRRTLTHETVATMVMEFGLLGGKYRDLSVDQAVAECATAAKACRTYGGTAVILFHTGQASGRTREFYGRLLDSLQ